MFKTSHFKLILLLPEFINFIFVLQSKNSKMPGFFVLNVIKMLNQSWVLNQPQFNSKQILILNQTKKIVILLSVWLRIFITLKKVIIPIKIVQFFLLSNDFNNLVSFHNFYHLLKPIDLQIFIIQEKIMACSKYEYVKQFQEHRTALLQTYCIVRIDGRGFTKFCEAHKFQKPNDIRAIELMNKAAFHVCQKFKNIFLAYGQSDEYSFVLNKDTELFNRRIDKIQTCIVSAFTSAYVLYWPKFFKDTPIIQLPSFDARIIQYPTLQIVKDYFRWRQVDCHINNLYNTVFWFMIKKGMKPTQVQNKLKDTNSGQKNQILFTQFGTNYNQIPEIYRKGTIISYKTVEKSKPNKQKQIFQSPKITKQLKCSIRDIKQSCHNTDRVINKLDKSELKQDKQLEEEMRGLRKQLQGIWNKYEEIQERIRKGGKHGMKDKGGKVELVVSSQDLIKEEFWESIKIQ